ncbi:hypothetical protein ElyMa_004450000 [Elysia marginata]|uniref:Uncharacterized protein n=1 Tax=Elysia marginata TaxID=1093978 RepID=A0AAV4HEL4_9GAST|nr:hypothetical protein ElyMa_004450000 [Elysia marginata]
MADTEKLISALGGRGKFQTTVHLLCGFGGFVPLCFNHVIMAFHGSSIPHKCMAGANTQVGSNFTFNTSGLQPHVTNISHTQCSTTLSYSDGQEKVTECTSGQWDYLPERLQASNSFYFYYLANLELDPAFSLASSVLALSSLTKMEASKSTVQRWRPQRPDSKHRTVNAMRVTVSVTGCGQRRPVCSTRSIRQVSPGRREDPDPQQPSSANRTLGCQDGHQTRTARWAEATSTARVDRSYVISKGGPKLRQ